ncbi:MAG: helix-turn-helix domain-containing protein [Bryobacteraceae bacterium]
MQLRCRKPHPPLDAFVETMWIAQSEPRPFALERLLPTGSASLIVNLGEDQVRRYHFDPRRVMETNPGAVLAGTSSRYAVIDTREQEYVAGVAFRCGGTAPFFRTPAHETRDADVSLQALWGRSRATRLRDRLLAAAGPDAELDALEAELMEALTPARPHAAVLYALARFGQGASVAAVAEAAGLSAKRFIERFKTDTGLTPKRHIRLVRFRRALARAHAGVNVEWARLAADCGYYDQAHFVRDFRDFSGIAPSGYASARTVFENHVKFVQDTRAKA